MPIFNEILLLCKKQCLEIEKEFGDERRVEKGVTLHLSLVYDLFLISYGMSYQGETIY
jgi:hypothetical protein